jgi:hypothetical protein
LQREYQYGLYLNNKKFKLNRRTCHGESFFHPTPNRL